MKVQLLPKPQRFRQDVFLSHASADKAEYIEPLAAALARRGLTYWLDSREIAWGDSIALRINEGLRESRFGLLCLSERYLERPWPEHEFSALLAMQNAAGVKRVLPLILNSRDEILRRYPLIAGLAYREFAIGPDRLADEVSSLIGSRKRPRGYITVAIESVHTGHISHLAVPGRASVEYLLEKARVGVGLRTKLDTGGFQPYPIRWVLVDAQAGNRWGELSERDRCEAVCVVADGDQVRICRSSRHRLGEAGVTDGMVFNLYAVPDRGPGQPRMTTMPIVAANPGRDRHATPLSLLIADVPFKPIKPPVVKPTEPLVLPDVFLLPPFKKPQQ
jgi:hypothetical protein